MMPPGRAVVALVLLQTTFAQINSRIPSFQDKLVKRPGLIQLCAGEDLPLGWAFRENTRAGISTIYWYIDDSGRIGHWTLDGGMVISDRYRGRVQQLPGYNAGIVIKNVSTTDSGMYTVDTTIRSEWFYDIADVLVYSDSELKPYLYINNREMKSEFYNSGGLDELNIIVTTHPDLSANISLHIDGTTVATCESQQSCSYKLPLADFSSYYIEYCVLYPVCHSYHGYLNITTEKACPEAAEYRGTEVWTYVDGDTLCAQYKCSSNFLHGGRRPVIVECNSTTGNWTHQTTDCTGLTVLQFSLICVTCTVVCVVLIFVMVQLYITNRLPCKHKYDDKDEFSSDDYTLDGPRTPLRSVHRESVHKDMEYTDAIEIEEISDR